MSAVSTRPRLPLTVIGGFLGAGKTTLLNRLLADAGGRRLAVLVNDFGALNIDAALVASNDGDTVALTNGCVCCSIGDDLTDALIGVIEAAVPFDAIVIEASGVSDPWRIAQVGLADPALVLDSVLVMVDASAVLAQAADPLLADSLARQIRSADFIVMNKCDLATPQARSAVRAWVTEHAPATPLFETQDAVVAPEVLRHVEPQGREVEGDTPHAHAHGYGQGQGQGHDHDHDHDHEHKHEHHHPADVHPHDHGAQFETWSTRPARPLSATTLRALLRDMPAGVLRLKGLVATDEHGWAEIQFAGRHGSLRKAASPPKDGAALVAIGLRGRLPLGDLRNAFDVAG